MILDSTVDSGEQTVDLAYQVSDAVASESPNASVEVPLLTPELEPAQPEPRALLRHEGHGHHPQGIGLVVVMVGIAHVIAFFLAMAPVCSSPLWG